MTILNREELFLLHMLHVLAYSLESQKNKSLIRNYDYLMCVHA